MDFDPVRVINPHIVASEASHNYCIETSPMIFEPQIAKQFKVTTEGFARVLIWNDKKSRPMAQMNASS